MKQIGFNNFRKFEHFPALELGKINLLVGGNNAGKSTFVKAVLLIYNFLHTKISDLQKGSIFGSMSPEMYFDVVSPYDVHIGTFYRAKRRGSILSEPIVFEFVVNNFHFVVKVSGTIVDKDIDKNAVSGKVVFLSIQDLESNTTYRIDYTSNRMSIDFKRSDISVYKTFEDDVKLRKQFETELVKETNFARIIELKERIAELNKHIHSFGDANTAEDSSLDLPLRDYTDTPEEYYLVNLIKSYNEYANEDPSAALNKNSKEYKKEVADKNLLKSKVTIILNSMRKLATAISHTDVEYIYAHAARQVIFFNSKDKNDYMAQTIHEFSSSKAMHHDKSIQFIEKWMGKDGFQIGESYSITEHGGEAYEISICNGKEETPLADMGMGSIQMMILLLRLSTFIKMYGSRTFPPTIIIEEPEQNLHPALQGKLADLFKYLNDEYNFSFIIETHSEYLIRKTQVLVAKEQWSEEDLDSKNPFKVYYFPTSLERFPYAMVYRKDGNFSNEFEPGFFDAANELLFEIL